MPSTPSLRRLMLVVFGFSLVLFVPLRADEDIHPTIEQIHGLLKEALGGDIGINPSNPDRTKFLKQARELLTGLPPGRYAGHRAHAVKLVNSALEKIDQGDAGDTAKEDIRDADSEVRDLE